jgi:hypothetical protein
MMLLLAVKTQMVKEVEGQRTKLPLLRQYQQKMENQIESNSK